MKTVLIENLPNKFFIPARDVLAVWNATSKEEARYYLNGVYVETALNEGARAVNLVATDGTILLKKLAAPGAFIGADVTTQDDANYAGFILSVDVLEKAFKAKGLLSDVWIYGDSETGILEFLDVGSDADAEAALAPLGEPCDRLGVCEFSRIDGNFPDWARVLPKDGAEGADFMSVNPKNLERLFKAGRIYSGLSLAVKFSSASEFDPIRVEFSGTPDLLGVVMPMRF